MSNQDLEKSLENDRKESKEVDDEGSVLDPHTDPFAERNGKTLIWKNVSMTLVSDWKSRVRFEAILKESLLYIY